MSVFHQLSKPSNDALASRGARGERQELMGRPHLGSQGPCPNISSNCREAPGKRALYGETRHRLAADTCASRTHAQAGQQFEDNHRYRPIGLVRELFHGQRIVRPARQKIDVARTLPVARGLVLTRYLDRVIEQFADRETPCPARLGIDCIIGALTFRQFVAMRGASTALRSSTHLPAMAYIRQGCMLPAEGARDAFNNFADNFFGNWRRQKSVNSGMKRLRGRPWGGLRTIAMAIKVLGPVARRRNDPVGNNT